MSSLTSPKTFTHLFCRNEQCLTPHSAGRVLALPGQVVELELHCRRCGAKVLYDASELPPGYHVYQVHVVGTANPALPASMRQLPRLEEEFTVIGLSRQDAKEQAELLCLLRFTGHQVQYIIDGVEHLDERF